MTISSDEQLETLLVDFAAPVADEARAVIAALRALRPDLQPTVRFGWRSVNFRHPRAGFVCAVFPMQDHVSLVFEQGRLLSNEGGLLQGDGKQVRFIPFRPGEPIPEEALGLLLAEAIALRG